MRTPLRELLHRYSVGRRTMVLLTVASTVQALLLVPVGFLIANLFGTSIPAGNTGNVLRDGGVILGLNLAAAAAGLYMNARTLRICADGTARLRAAVAERLMAMPLGWHAEHPGSEIHATILPQFDRINEMAVTVFSVGPSIVVAVPLVVVAGIISPVLILTVLVVVPVGIAAAWITRRGIIEHTRSFQNAWARWSLQMQTMLRAIELIRTSGTDAAEVGEAWRRTDELAAIGYTRSLSIVRASTVQATVSSISAAIVLIVGGLLVASHHLALHALLAFYAVLALLLRQLAGLAAASGVVPAGGEALRRVVDLIEDPTPDPYGPGREISFDGSVSLANVTFGYRPPTPVLSDLSFSVPAGRHCAIIGPNGVGKTSVGNLVLGHHRPWSGQVLASGMSYDDLDVAALRREISVVSQFATLLPLTVAENVTYGAENPALALARARRSRVIQAVIDALPDGWDTRLEDERVRLSGGQSQRIALTRALARRPRLLILDEPTTHLDLAAVDLFLEDLSELDPPPTILTITHDRALADRADLIVDLHSQQFRTSHS